jgi:hypothetical protein
MENVFIKNDYKLASKMNQKIFKNIQITSQEDMIIKSLNFFYENDEHIDIFLNIINLNSLMSIRLIDYFVTKYSKNNKITYKLNDENTNKEQSFNIYTSYKQQLKAYQKKHFDPFSRGDRIPYFLGEQCIITTIGQLNFFKWLISKKVYEYIRDNFEKIQNEMNNKKPKVSSIVKTKKITKPKYNHKVQIKNIINKSENIINDNKCKNIITDKIIVSFSL